MPLLEKIETNNNSSKNKSKKQNSSLKSSFKKINRNQADESLGNTNYGELHKPVLPPIYGLRADENFLLAEKYNLKKHIARDILDSPTLCDISKNNLPNDTPNTHNLYHCNDSLRRELKLGKNVHTENSNLNKNQLKIISENLENNIDIVVSKTGNSNMTKTVQTPSKVNDIKTNSNHVSKNTANNYPEISRAKKQLKTNSSSKKRCKRLASINSFKNSSKFLNETRPVNLSKPNDRVLKDSNKKLKTDLNRTTKPFERRQETTSTLTTVSKIEAGNEAQKKRLTPIKCTSKQKQKSSKIKSLAALKNKLKTEEFLEQDNTKTDISNMNLNSSALHADIDATEKNYDKNEDVIESEEIQIDDLLTDENSLASSFSHSHIEETTTRFTSPRRETRFKTPSFSTHFLRQQSLPPIVEVPESSSEDTKSKPDIKLLVHELQQSAENLLKIQPTRSKEYDIKLTIRNLTKDDNKCENFFSTIALNRVKSAQNLGAEEKVKLKEKSVPKTRRNLSIQRRSLRKPKESTPRILSKNWKLSEYKGRSRFRQYYTPQQYPLVPTLSYLPKTFNTILPSSYGVVGGIVVLRKNNWHTCEKNRR